ncbi:MAG: ABC transporter ATP-binding protein [Desulfobacterales bacterium]|jgi:peptide/nickel transport system ATP-binding protein|nr:ABC transporter ATP-binding protein [Desulfobacterales bacterium]
MTRTLTIQDLVVEAQKPSGEWFGIVHNVDVKVKSGEVVALIGESGAGKTTVGLGALAYSRPGTRIVGGQVYLDDIDLLSMAQEERREVRGKQVAYVAQSAAAALNPAIRLGEQVTESLLVHGILEPEKGLDRVVELFRLLDLPSPKSIANRYPHQVSGGQQQRVMTAMAMACLPDFIVFDEPTTALDVTTQVEVLKAIKDVIQQKGSGAIYVSHDLAVVAQVADRIMVMYNGRIVEASKTEDILNAPCEAYTRQLLNAVRLAPGDSEDFSKTEVKKTEDGQPLIELKDIHASYQKGSWLKPVPEEQYILRNVNFAVHAGEVVALVGESGSGKSTIARVITGLLAPISGEVRCLGTPIPPKVKGRRLEQLRRIQMVCQSPDTTLNPQQQISEAIGRPLELYYGLKGKAKLKRVQDLLAMVELPPDYAYRYPPELSGGEKQRVSLARAFGVDPELILCDEVLSALDTIVASAILELLKDLQKRLGVTYLFISHDLATVATIADRVIVLYAGRVCEDGPMEKVFSPPYHPYTALLMSSVPELRCGWLEDVLNSRVAAKGVNAATALMDCGCAFRLRCPLSVKDLCAAQTPSAQKFADGHIIYCHRNVDRLLELE